MDPNMKAKTEAPVAGQAAAPKSTPRRAAPLIAIAVAAILGAVFLRDVLSFDALAENREALEAFRDAHYLATAAAFILAYVAIVAFSLPGATIATLTGGFLFGVFPGTLFNVLAATIGAAAIFLAARWGLGAKLSQQMEAGDGVVSRIKAGIDENQWSMLFLIRLVPAVPFFVANLVPALVGVPLRRFVISTFLGIIPGGLVYTSVGAGLGDIFARGEKPDLGIIFEPQILLPILGLCALAALPIVIKALRGRKGI
ncbi:MAG: TVP38/TMEM64 family protein [Paracoccaceae bacterium]